MGVAVTVHIVVVVVVVAAAGKETALLKKKLFSLPFLVNKYGVISTVYVSPDCTPYSVTLGLLTVITLCAYAQQG